MTSSAAIEGESESHSHAPSPLSSPGGRGGNAATFALLLATLFWGCGFTWAKTAGETVNAMTEAGAQAALGPVWVLAVRFLLAGVLWLIVFPDARRGWDVASVRRTLILGGLLSAGMIVQHLGLDRTSEAVSAFLTSLTILFVPLMMTVALRRPPPAAVWLGVVLAGVGVWLMTGASASGLGLGEVLGLICAVSYSFDIIAVGALVTPANAARVTAGQFLVVGVVAAAMCLLLPGGPANLAPARVAALMAEPKIGINVALLAVLVSMGAFGLQFRFQPRIDPTRAALLYLVEPIFASLYAFLVGGRRMSALAVAGAGLILGANLLVEILQSRKGAAEQAAAVGRLGPAVID